jgi:hypothetical protein
MTGGYRWNIAETVETEVIVRTRCYATMGQEVIAEKDCCNNGDRTPLG